MPPLFFLWSPMRYLVMLQKNGDNDYSGYFPQFQPTCLFFATSTMEAIALAPNELRNHVMSSGLGWPDDAVHEDTVKAYRTHPNTKGMMFFHVDLN